MLSTSTTARQPTREPWSLERLIHARAVALAVFAAHDYPEGIEPDIDAHATFDPENFSYPHGTHLCAVEVDTETGFVQLHKYVCVDDVGTVINPLIVEGQIHGGLAQGIAQALFEDAHVLGVERRPCWVSVNGLWFVGRRSL